MAGEGGPVQRQLPLCEERVGVPARGLRCHRAALSRDVRTARRRGATPPAAAAGADPDRRRLRQRPGARRRRLRVDRRVGRDGAAAGRAVARRPVRALHRRHDRDAEGRAVAPARHLHDVVRWQEHVHRRGRRLLRRDRQARRGESRHQDLHPAAADARRRAVGRHDRAHHRADGRIPCHPRQIRRRRGRARRSSGRRF